MCSRSRMSALTFGEYVPKGGLELGMPKFVGELQETLGHDPLPGGDDRRHLAIEQP
jgi:hypothetical protein